MTPEQVNPTNKQMVTDGGGANGAIHRAAGRQLQQACLNLLQVRPGVRCPTG
ncbi:hypothetical protein Patl1_36728 [Pistacia atlantica]|nr:hypothetical protein Patl1_36728 [Pistacia atlantica]